MADPPRELADVMCRFELDCRFALMRDDSSETCGLGRSAVLERVRESALFLNVMGLISDPEVLGCAERRVFLDIDPGFLQMWTMLGLYHGFREHLERGYQLVLSLPDACFIFKLHGPQGRVDEPKGVLP